MKFYTEDIAAVFDGISSSAEGLSSQEAAERLEKNGKNQLKQAKKDSLLKRFLNQLKDPMIIILLIAAFVSAATEMAEAAANGHAIPFPTDALIILAVVIINSVLGVYQESKAEKAIEALQEISAATSRVLRDGKISSVRSEELVVGDVVLLEAGDAVPADCRIFESASLKIEEAALTGESVPVNKYIDVITPSGDDVPLGDRKNMGYMGSTVVYGRGKAVVTGPGMDTEMGKIADAIATAEEGQTPLQIKLAQLSKILSLLVIGICVFIFGFNIVEHLVLNKPIDLTFGLSSFMTAVSLAVAAIPEGLVA
ncbi:MAG: HAD-IC family P-type ATPase, partial [Oscillospiraceae bacterium]|nr:HAD-IC family P-type ATPase [Oscillospiraceae bacterium]